MISSPFRSCIHISKDPTGGCLCPDNSHIFQTVMAPWNLEFGVFKKQNRQNLETSSSLHKKRDSPPNSKKGGPTKYDKMLTPHYPN